MHHRFHDDMGDDLRDQLTNLRDEVASLRKQVARSGRRGYGDVRHMGAETADRMRDYAEHALPELRRSARHLQQSARENPTATATIAAASLVVLGLAAALMMRR
ncbi:hypothetical protein [Chelativorans sp. M5D2P16]|uniref:hypothetical protein n=1 Tax=Chelativorans sp. M5D2P16 TaxID=3095678 RepID=UPI002ACABA87|nr:hypothetical protein [Chelativorans sp. M5D2P16]MDZ5699198.1 hypothetical protein [Chelativorans sp. M5D2P16]